MATTKISQKQVKGLKAALSALSGAIQEQTLTAGSNITISGGVISADVPTYSAGNGITISNGEISADVQIPTPTMTYHTHLSGTTATLAEISGKTSVKIYKNGVLLRAAGTEATPGTLEFRNVTGLADIIQVDDADISLDIDGTAQQIDNCDFTSCATLEDVADAITEAAAGKVYCEVNSTGLGLVFISPTLGADSSVATNGGTPAEMIAAFGGSESGNMVASAGQASASAINDYSASGTTVTFAEQLSIHDLITTECL